MRRSPISLKLLALLLLLAAAFAHAGTDLPTGAHERAPQQYLDLTTDHWAADAIYRLSALGVLTGYPGGTFGGTRAATRYELAVVAARLLDLVSSSLTELVSDPEFRAVIENAARDAERLDRLEELVEGGADGGLAGRLRAVEDYLNREAGEQLFPATGAPAGGSRSAAASSGLTDTEMAEILSQLEQQLLRSRTASEPGTYFGVFTGWPVAGGLQIGMRDVFLEHVNARFGIGYALPGAFSMELAAFYEWPGIFGPSEAALYAGGGILARVGRTAALDLELLAGVEYALPDGPVSVFGELGPGFTLAPVAGDAGLIVRVGMNYGF